MGGIRPYIDTIALAARANPNAYAQTTVAIPRQALADAQQMARLLHRLTAHSPLCNQLLQGMPEGARHYQGNVDSIFSCLDYHLTAKEGLRLIEANTHASGGIASVLWQGHLQRKRLVKNPVFSNLGAVMERYWKGMEADWQAFTANREQPLRSIGILDDDPPRQAFYNEFLLAKALLEERGYRVQILDARNCQELGVDLVYNRCCDFYFEAPEHRFLQEALLQDNALFTPSPHMHAIIGKKDLLVYLHEMAIGGWPLAPLDADDRAFLRRIVPEARFLTDANRDALLADKTQWVFKPRDRYQAKGVFRGKSMTHATFATFASGEYIAQAFVPPSKTSDDLKAEIRFYHHGAHVQFGAARVYAGQVTNFRDSRGGNAPLVFAD